MTLPSPRELERQIAALRDDDGSDVAVTADVVTVTGEDTEAGEPVDAELPAGAVELTDARHPAVTAWVAPTDDPTKRRGPGDTERTND